MRCREHKLNAYIVVGMSANPEVGEFQEYTVRLRFDSAPAVSQHWSESTDNEALFAPAPLEFAHRLAKTERLLFEFTPFHASPATVEFDTHGFEPALKEVLAACKQK